VYKSQKRKTVTPTRIRFKPKGFISEGEIYFTILKLIPNKRLAVSTAQCALIVLVEFRQLFFET
jgi:hypothetical protein